MNYLLDANVFIQAARKRGDPKIKAWIGSLVPAQLFLSPVLVAECLAGVFWLGVSPARRAEIAFLKAALQQYQYVEINRRVAVRWGVLRAKLKRTVSLNDLWLAALALNNGLTVATGNVKDFAPLKVPTRDPFRN